MSMTAHFLLLALCFASAAQGMREGGAVRGAFSLLKEENAPLSSTLRLSAGQCARIPLPMRAAPHLLLRRLRGGGDVEVAEGSTWEQLQVRLPRTLQLIRFLAKLVYLRSPASCAVHYLHALNGSVNTRTSKVPEPRIDFTQILF